MLGRLLSSLSDLRYPTVVSPSGSSESRPALSPTQLSIVSRIEPDGVTLTICGELDIASAPRLERELRDAEDYRPRRIVLDLAALDFIDSTGIHLLLHAQRRADANGHDLLLTRVPPQAQRLFRLTGISARLILE